MTFLPQNSSWKPLGFLDRIGLFDSKRRPWDESNEQRIEDVWGPRSRRDPSIIAWAGDWLARTREEAISSALNSRSNKFQSTRAPMPPMSRPMQLTEASNPQYLSARGAERKGWNRSSLNTTPTPSFRPAGSNGALNNALGVGSNKFQSTAQPMQSMARNNPSQMPLGLLGEFFTDRASERKKWNVPSNGMAPSFRPAGGTSAVPVSRPNFDSMDPPHIAALKQGIAKNLGIQSNKFQSTAQPMQSMAQSPINLQDHTTERRNWNRPTSESISFTPSQNSTQEELGFLTPIFRDLEHRGVIESSSPSFSGKDESFSQDQGFSNVPFSFSDKNDTHFNDYFQLASSTSGRPPQMGHNSGHFPQKEENKKLAKEDTCRGLVSAITSRVKDMTTEVEYYDLVADAKGSPPEYQGKPWKPHGHYKKYQDHQNGLRNEKSAYLENGCDELCEEGQKEFCLPEITKDYLLYDIITMQKKYAKWLYNINKTKPNKQDALSDTWFDDVEAVFNDIRDYDWAGAGKAALYGAVDSVPFDLGKKTWTASRAAYDALANGQDFGSSYDKTMNELVASSAAAAAAHPYAYGTGMVLENIAERAIPVTNVMKLADYGLKAGKAIKASKALQALKPAKIW